MPACVRASIVHTQRSPRIPCVERSTRARDHINFNNAKRTCQACTHASFLCGTNRNPPAHFATAPSENVHVRSDVFRPTIAISCLLRVPEMKMLEHLRAQSLLQGRRIWAACTPSVCDEQTFAVVCVVAQPHIEHVAQRMSDCHIKRNLQVPHHQTHNSVYFSTSME